jgi:site-specific DNA-cytosine methylase
MKSWSFFSGAMGLDLDLEKVGIAAEIALENDPFPR